MQAHTYHLKAPPPPSLYLLGKLFPPRERERGGEESLINYNCTLGVEEEEAEETWYFIVKAALAHHFFPSKYTRRVRERANNDDNERAGVESTAKVRRGRGEKERERRGMMESSFFRSEDWTRSSGWVTDADDVLFTRSYTTNLYNSTCSITAGLSLKISYQRKE